MANGFKKIKRADSFKKDFKNLDAQQRKALESCVQDLLKPIIPEGRRFHVVDRGTPKVFTVDLYKNVTTHKVSLEIDSNDPQLVILRRVGQHKDIDRSP